MKKPHEQEWRQEGFRYVERRDTTETVAEIPMRGPDETVALTRFIASAPKMARALAKFVGNHDADCACGGCEALREAGVLEGS